MSIASRIESMESNISNAYKSLDDLGIDLTNTNKNIENISTKIDDVYNMLSKVSGTGTDITLNNTAKGRLLKNDLSGRTEQEQLTGKNLFNLTAQDFKNGTIVGYASRVFLGGLKPNTIYICSTNDPAELGSSTTNLLFGGANSTVNGVNISSPKKATSNENGEIEVLLRTTNIDAFLNNYWVQIEEGSIATSYEPYCGRNSSTKSTDMNVLLKM